MVMSVERPVTGGRLAEALGRSVSSGAGVWPHGASGMSPPHTLEVPPQIQGHLRGGEDEKPVVVVIQVVVYPFAYRPDADTPLEGDDGIESAHRHGLRDPGAALFAADRNHFGR